MSSDENEEIGVGKRKRKVPRLSDSPVSTSSSSGSPIIGTSTSRLRRRNFGAILESSDSDSSEESLIFLKKKKVGRVETDSDFSSNNSSPIIQRRFNARTRVLESEHESGDSDRVVSPMTVWNSDSDSDQWASDYFDSDQGFSRNAHGQNSSTNQEEIAIESDHSDGQSEKCPICLLSFKQQKVGIPETCEHSFCLDCIQEWSKNMNTCPVDRLEYHSINVRKSLNGDYLKNLPIKRQEQQDSMEVVEDITYCEICGAGDNEDRLLLCDGCERGYHLYCLTPPLDEVPDGYWYCSNCNVMLNALNEGLGRIRQAARRLVPRTTHSERVRRRVANIRNRRQMENAENRPSTSRVSSNRVSSTSAARRKPRKRRARKPAKYKTVWVINELGEAVPAKKRVTSGKRKSKHRRRRKKVSPKKTPKERLATQLGMCVPQHSAQTIPEVRIPTGNANDIGQIRYRAGIPSLDLVGNVNRLDDFVQSEDEGIFNENEPNGIHVLSRRALNPTDVLRRVARRKAVTMDNQTVSSSTDILGSIMDSQAKLLSKSSILSVVDSSGKLIIENKEKLVNAPSKPDFNSYTVRQTPWHGQNYSNYRPYNRNNYSNNRNNWQHHSRDYQGRYSNYGQGSSGGHFGQQHREQQFNDTPQDYTQRTLCEAEMLQEEEKDKRAPSANTPDTDLDIYGDIENETVSTSRVEEECKPPSPPLAQSQISNTNTDEDNDSETDMVIDTERCHDEPVSSTVTADQNVAAPVYSPDDPTTSQDQPTYSPGDPTDSPDQAQISENPSNFDAIQEVASEYAELQKEFASGFKEFQPLMNMTLKEDQTAKPDPAFREEYISTHNELNSNLNIPLPVESQDKNDDDEVSNDGCPNFSIYSRQSKTVALTTDISLSTIQNDNNVSPEPQEARSSTSGNLLGLYSDSEDESVVKKSNSFAISDIKDMTEDIVSEEERSYTPVLDEPREKSKEGLEGLETEMISDDDRNDFDESHELKTISDGDALEINAKESELEFTRPEDFEDGEIVDKNKEKACEETAVIPENKPSKKKTEKKAEPEKAKKKKKDSKEKKVTMESGPNKENVNKETFKKLTKSSKERNYRDKDKDRNKDSTRERSRSKSPDLDKESKRKKERRKELERYNVRAIIADKPRQPPKDQFGRDLRRTSSRSRSRSYTPPLSPTRVRRSPSPIRAPTPVSRRKSRSASRERTPPRSRRSVSKRRSSSRTRNKSGKRKARSRSRSRSKSADRKRDRSKTKKRKRSASRSNKRKKSKEKSKKRGRRSLSRRRQHSHSRSVSPRRNRREWTPSLSRSPSPAPHHVSPSWTPPHSEPTSSVLRKPNFTVILTNDATKKKKEKRNKEKRKKDDSPSKRRRREKERSPPPSKEVFASGDNILVSVSFNNESETRDVSTREGRRRKETGTDQPKKKTKTKKDLSGVKPVAIIDLERSPFQEIVSSPKDVIVLSDSDNNETENINMETSICDSSQQLASPEETSDYLMGPKTPPEPSVKFSLLPKPPQVRAINNPLHDPLETVEEEETADLNGASHKGPNTPPEPPSSPPSSPDVYDPFEPTKSRSATPEAGDALEESGEEQNVPSSENRPGMDTETSSQTPDITKSLTPPIPDIQPADSQSSIQEITETKSPEESSVQLAQTTGTAMTKPVAQTIPFSSTQTTSVSAAPVSSTITISRINILNSSMLTAASTVPQRIVLPNQAKSSPVKIPPTKAPPKSTPVKPLPAKSPNKKSGKAQNGNNADEANLDFESPYSPGSSDYEDLFEPPSEPLAAAAAAKTKSKTKQQRPAKKGQSTFDTLFGSPNYNKTKTKAKTVTKKAAVVPVNKTKHIGVKIDEDSLKILEDLPNSAVEMQVKDKFLKKLNRQERVVEEVKLVLKPFYNKKKIGKEEYKDIMRRAVPKICHNKSGEINPNKIRHLIEAYVKKVKHSKKVTSSSSLPQKI